MARLDPERPVRLTPVPSLPEHRDSDGCPLLTPSRRWPPAPPSDSSSSSRGLTCRCGRLAICERPPDGAAPRAWSTAAEQRRDRSHLCDPAASCLAAVWVGSCRLRRAIRQPTRDAGLARAARSRPATQAATGASAPPSFRYMLRRRAAMIASGPRSCTASGRRGSRRTGAAMTQATTQEEHDDLAGHASADVLVAGTGASRPRRSRAARVELAKNNRTPGDQPRDEAQATPMPVITPTTHRR